MPKALPTMTPADYLIVLGVYLSGPLTIAFGLIVFNAAPDAVVIAAFAVHFLAAWLNERFPPRAVAR